MVDSKKAHELRIRKQAYPKFQLKMEKYQLILDRAATMGDMKTVGEYNVLINKIWAKHYREWHL